MKKIYLKWGKDFESYGIFNNSENNYSELYFLYQFFNDRQIDWIYVNTISKKNMVSIWSDEYIKQHADIEFATKQEYYDFLDRHEKYYDKRWDEMPKLALTIQDYDDLEHQFKQLKKEQPQYVVFELYGTEGEFDKVRIIGKDELSEEDKEYIKVEHEKYLKYKCARDKYLEHHPDHSEVWRGPQDDEYEADIMKYYED